MAIFLVYFRSAWSVQPQRETTILRDVREKQPFLAPAVRPHLPAKKVRLPFLVASQSYAKMAQHWQHQEKGTGGIVIDKQRRFYVAFATLLLESTDFSPIVFPVNIQ